MACDDEGWIYTCMNEINVTFDDGEAYETTNYFTNKLLTGRANGGSEGEKLTSIHFKS